MAFPPRPPMGVPPVQPAMMPQGYAFTPMGMNMMHMGMRMMPPASMMPRPMNMGVPVTAPAVTKPQQTSLTPPGITPKADSDGEKYPTTTVFVGNISDKAPDTMVRTMLQRCGNVLSWKRVIGASGKLQAFGFCEYDHPESTLRCIRLLNEWAIADKKLVVKVDAKTKTLLDEYKAKKSKKEEESKEKGDGDKSSPSAENGVIDVELDEDTQREDRVAKAGLDAIMREYAGELNKVIIDDPEDQPLPEKHRDDKKYQNRKDKEIQNIEELELDTDKKDLINREIRIFRDQHKGEEPQNLDKHRDRDKGGEDVRRRERMERVERQREREHQRQREREMKMERDRERMERERERSRSNSRSRTPVRERERDRERLIRRRSHDRESREKSHTHDHSKHSNNRERREREREQEIEEEEEAHERRKLEKQMREKEAAYRDRLKAWESRENKKIREYKKEKDRESDRKAEEAKEARRLKEFLEDYDDIRDDAKYYKGSALSRRLKEREKEQEADERDRQREKEEHEEIRMRLMDEGHPDIEGEMARLEQQREEHLLPPDPIPVDSPSPPPVQQDEAEIMEAPDERVHILEEPIDYDDDEPIQIQQAELPTRSKQSYTEQSSYREHTPYTEEASSYSERQSYPEQVSYSDRFSYPERTPYPEAPTAPASRLVEESPENDTPNRTPPPSMNEDGHISNTPVFGPAPKEAIEETSATGFGSLKIVAADSPAEDSPQVKDNGVIKRRKPLTVGDVFNQDDEEESGVKKRKLVPLDYEEEKQEKKPTTVEEKRASIKKLIERIPTAKDELFAYKLDWSMVDKVLMDKRIKPWVDKKIIEYIGEEEPTLTEFICQKVMAQSTPQAILNDVAMVLDEEAEVFIVKMWRLLIYETEAKRAGLVK